MIKFITVVLSSILSFSVIVNGDTITLRKVNKNVELRIIGITDKYINVVISKKALKSLDIRCFKDGEFPDSIFLKVINTAIDCKVKEAAGDSIQALIPTSEISSLQAFFQADDKQNKTVPAERSQTRGINSEENEIPPLEAEIQEPPASEKEVVVENKIVDNIKLDPEEKKCKDYRLRSKKNTIKYITDKGYLLSAETESGHSVQKMENEKPQEKGTETPLTNQISEKDYTKNSLSKTGGEEGGLNEVEKIQKESGETIIPDRRPINDSLSKDRTKPVEEDLKKEKPLDPNLGRVEARILKGGKPLPNCQVKLQMLEKHGWITKWYRPVKETMEFETTTDKKGIYYFMNMALGLYKLYWKPPTESAWIRRFKIEPDVLIEPGKLTNAKDIETLKRTAVGVAPH